MLVGSVHSRLHGFSRCTRRRSRLPLASEANLPCSALASQKRQAAVKPLSKVCLLKAGVFASPVDELHSRLNFPPNQPPRAARASVTEWHFEPLTPLFILEEIQFSPFTPPRDVAPQPASESLGGGVLAGRKAAQDRLATARKQTKASLLAEPRSARSFCCYLKKEGFST